MSNRRLSIILLKLLCILHIVPCSFANGGFYKCHPNKIASCKQWSNGTYLPNLFGEVKQEAISEKLATFLPKIKPHCSMLLEHFVCSIYAPPCIDGLEFPVPPCKSLCMFAKAGCEPLVSALDPSVSLMMECDNYRDDTLCLSSMIQLRRPHTAPSPPGSLTLKPIDSRTLFISWEPHREPVTGYHLWTKGKKGNKDLMLGPEARNYTLKGLRPNAKYRVKLSVFNGAGESDFTYKKIVLPESEKKEEQTITSRDDPLTATSQGHNHLTHDTHDPRPHNTLDKKNGISPRRYDIKEYGEPYYFSGWVDVQGQGAANDYCRVIGRGRSSFLSCALAGTHSERHFYVSEKGFNVGWRDTWFMRDMDDDGRDDYCRCVGSKTHSRVSCMKAGDRGFYGSITQRGSQYTFDVPGTDNCHRKRVNPYFGL